MSVTSFQPQLQFRRTTTVQINLKPKEVEYLKINDRGYRAGEKPDPGVLLAARNFMKEFYYILQTIFDRREPNPDELPQLLQLKLTNEAVAETEAKRVAAGFDVQAHPVSRGLYIVGCLFLDKFFGAIQGVYQPV